jgi:hypothetical protein
MSQRLILEMSGQTWHVPIDNLHMVLRVGDSIRFGTDTRGVVKDVEYALASEAPPVQFGRQMPADVFYARPTRVVIKA